MTYSPLNAVGGQEGECQLGRLGDQDLRHAERLMARNTNNCSQGPSERATKTGSDLGLNRSERVTGIEPALSAWESVLFGLLYSLSCKKACP